MLASRLQHPLCTDVTTNIFLIDTGNVLFRDLPIEAYFFLTLCLLSLVMPFFFFPFSIFVVAVAGK